MNSYLLHSVNTIGLGVLPLICRYISVSSGHSRAYWSTISGNYLLVPERWIFGVGVTLFVLVHIGINGYISTRLLNHASSSTQLFASTIELYLLGIFLLIAWIPAHLILGMHALLGGMLFCSVILWMLTIMQNIKVNAVLFYAMYICTSISIIMLCLMIVYFPADLIAELVSARNDIPKKLYLLGIDERWSNFAICEWLFFYSVVIFMQLCG